MTEKPVVDHEKFDAISSRSNVSRIESNADAEYTKFSTVSVQMQVIWRQEIIQHGEELRRD